MALQKASSIDPIPAVDGAHPDCTFQTSVVIASIDVCDVHAASEQNLLYRNLAHAAGCSTAQSAHASQRDVRIYGVWKPSQLETFCASS